MSQYRARFPRTAESARAARRALKEFVRLWFHEPELNDIMAAVGEALANCVEHGRGSEIEVRCWREDECVTIEIAGSKSFDFLAAMKKSESAETSALRGYGMRIMRGLMDSLQYLDRGRTVRLTKRLPTPGRATDRNHGDAS